MMRSFRWSYRTYLGNFTDPDIVFVFLCECPVKWFFELLISACDAKAHWQYMNEATVLLCSWGCCKHVNPSCIKEISRQDDIPFVGLILLWTVYSQRWDEIHQSLSRDCLKTSPTAHFDNKILLWPIQRPMKYVPLPWFCSGDRLFQNTPLELTVPLISLENLMKSNFPVPLVLSLNIAPILYYLCPIEEQWTWLICIPQKLQ